MKRFALLVLLGFGILRPHVAAAGTGDAFLLLTARDTVSIERFERTERQVSGALLFRIAQARFDFTLTLEDDARVSVLTTAYRTLPYAAGDPPKQVATAEFRGDSVIADAQPGGVQRMATRAGAVPFMNPSFVMIEQVLRRAVVVGGARVTVPLFLVTGGQTIACDVERVGADSMALSLGGVGMRFRVDAEGGILGGVIPSQGTRLLRVTNLPEALLDVPQLDYSAPADAPYTAENVRVTLRDGQVLAGTLTMPRGGKSKFPAVVTITGSGTSDRDESLPIVRGYRPFRQVADVLGRRGIAVLRLDDRGYGSTGGSAANATSADYAHDIEDALRWLRARAGIDGARLALVGHSEGGLIAPMVAASDPALRGIVLLAGPAYDGRRILEYQLSRSALKAAATLARRDSIRRETLEGIESLGAKSPWTRFFLDHDPLATARTVKVPVLIVQGETDHQITPEQAALLERAFREGGNRDVTRRMIPAANHLLVNDPDGSPEGYLTLADANVRPDVLQALADWLAVHLR